MVNGTFNRASSGDAIESLVASIRLLRDIWLDLIAYNVMWFFAALPLITAPPVTAALYVTLHDLGQGQHVSWRTFWSAFKRYFGVAWRWGALNLLVGGLAFLNLWFASGLPYTLALLFRVLWWGAVAIWLALQLYCFPLLLEQERPAVLLALRNAMVLGLRHPAFTFIYLMVTIAIAIAVSGTVPALWLIFIGALLVHLHVGAVQYLMAIEQGKPPMPPLSEPPQ